MTRACTRSFSRRSPASHRRSRTLGCRTHGIPVAAGFSSYAEVRETRCPRHASEKTRIDYRQIIRTGRHVAAGQYLSCWPPWLSDGSPERTTIRPISRFPLCAGYPVSPGHYHVAPTPSTFQGGIDLRYVAVVIGNPLVQQISCVDEQRSSGPYGRCRSYLNGGYFHQHRCRLKVHGDWLGNKRYCTRGFEALNLSWTKVIDGITWRRGPPRPCWSFGASSDRSLCRISPFMKRLARFIPGPLQEVIWCYALTAGAWSSRPHNSDA